MGGVKRVKVRTEKVRVRGEAGGGELEFEVPTWDPEPVPWNESGSWAKDKELSGRLAAELRAWLSENVPGGEGEEGLLAEAEEAVAAGGEWPGRACRTFWGSHGCDREDGHRGLCICGIRIEDGPCSAIWKLEAEGGEGGDGGDGGDDEGGPAIMWLWFVGGMEFTLSTLGWRWFR